MTVIAYIGRVTTDRRVLENIDVDLHRRRLHTINTSHEHRGHITRLTITPGCVEADISVPPPIGHRWVMVLGPDHAAWDDEYRLWRITGTIAGVTPIPIEDWPWK